jgi:hypothetical protein
VRVAAPSVFCLARACADQRAGDFRPMPLSLDADPSAGGAGAANTQVFGEVYKLRTISDFKGLSMQRSGGPGLDSLAPALPNRAGVVLHLKGTQKRVTLSLGREEILIEMI